MTTTADSTPDAVRDTADTDTADTGTPTQAGPEIAEGADSEHRQTGHATAATDQPPGADADAEPGEGRAHQLVWLDPAALTVHPRNIRGDLGDLEGLAASIAAQGVLEALTVVPTTNQDGTAGHQLVAGHRRAAAAVLAGRPSVPCVLRPDLAAAEEDQAAQARHVGAMLAENTYRAGLSAVEEARGVQAMLDLGVSLTRVAKTTGLGRRRVAKAAGVARLDDGTAAAVTAAGLTLDQAAAVAVYAEDPDTTAQLVAAAAEGPGAFAHALARAKQDREEAEARAALTGELAAAGRTVLDNADGAAHARLSQLSHAGEPITGETHTGCPGSAVCVTTDWRGVRAVEVCTDPAGNGHTSRYGNSTLPGASTGEPGEEQQEAATEQRRATIEGNKAMSAATQTRREFVRALLTRRSAPRGALRFVVDTLPPTPGCCPGGCPASSTRPKIRQPPTST